MHITDSDLIKYCQEGNLEMVKKAFETNKTLTGAVYYYSKGMRKYAIVEAAKNGYTDIVIFLLKQPNIKANVQANAAMLRAAENCHLDVIKVLVEEAKLNPAYPAQNPLLYAAKNGCVEVVKYLLTHKYVDVDHENNSIIYSVAKSGQLDVVKLLLNELKVKKKIDYNYLLDSSVISGNLELVKYIVNTYNVKVHPTSYGIITACDYDYQDIVDFLYTEDVLEGIYTLPQVAFNKVKKCIAKKLNMSVDDVMILYNIIN